MDETQRVLFARLLCRSQLSHFRDVMVFISWPVEEGGGSPWKPSSWIWEQRQHSAAPARETGCNVMLAQDPDSCYDPKHKLFSVWPAPTVNNHSRRSWVSAARRWMQCVEGRSGRSLTYKNIVRAAKLCRNSHCEVYLEQSIRNRSHPEVFSEGSDPVFSRCYKKKTWTERESAAIQIHPADSLSQLFSCQRDQETFPSTLGFCSAEQSSANKRCIVYLLLWGKIPALKRILVLFFWSYPGGKTGHHFLASPPPQMDRCMLSLSCRWWENIIPSVLSWRNTGLSFCALQNSSVVIN